jgi:predicted transcriptional regulator
MNANEDLAQNTVQTFLRMMEEKGLVSHHLEGRSFIYRPLYSREKTLSRFVQRVFDGSLDQLVMSALSTKKVSPKELSAIEALIQAEKKRQGL